MPKSGLFDLIRSHLLNLLSLENDKFANDDFLSGPKLVIFEVLLYTKILILEFSYLELCCLLCLSFCCLKAFFYLYISKESLLDCSTFLFFTPSGRPLKGQREKCRVSCSFSTHRKVLQLLSFRKRKSKEKIT